MAVISTISNVSVEDLPEECLSHIISFTSPSDACSSSIASSTFRQASNSDFLWEKFLPSDYRDILSRSVYPVEFESKKDLFCQLSSTPLLIDGGKKTFAIDKYRNKKCYMLSARELSITWSTNSLYWCWKHLQQSRFPEAIELVMVCWLEIMGKVSTQMLSPNTTYGAYLVVQLAGRAFGLDTLASEVSVEVGDYKTRGTNFVKRHECKRRGLNVSCQEGGNVVCERSDGWLEIELGEFYNDESEKEVKMLFRETKGEHLKGGLVVEGIELRPKH